MTKHNKNNNTELKALKKYVMEDDVSKVKKLAEGYHPFDLAQIILDWDNESRVKLIRFLPENISSEILRELDSEMQEEILAQLKDKEVDSLVSEMEADDLVDILDDVTQEISKKIIRNTDSETRRDLNKIMKYADNETGHHMSLNFISLSETLTVRKALSEIKNLINKEDAELAGLILLVDKDDFLKGAVSIEDLLSAPENKRLSSYKTEIQSINPGAPLKEARDLIADYNLDALPVVNKNGRLIGVVEPEDIVEVLAEVEDKHFSFVQSSSRTKKGKKVKEYKPYGKLTSYDIFKSRIFWILTLLFLGLVTQVIIMLFQMVWATTGFWASPGVSAVGGTIVTLAFSSALSIASSINDSAGNSGSQSTSVLIEAIALGEIKLEDHGKALRKEVLAGSHTGLAVAIGSFFRTYIVWAVFGILGQGAANDAGMDMATYQLWLFIIASIAAVSFYISVVFGNFIGSWLPLLGTKKGWKSSVISGPVTTTFVDIFVFSLYLGLTTAVFVPLVNNGVLG